MIDHNLYVFFRQYVLQALRQSVPDLPEALLERVELTPTKDPAHGDMATNAALIIAKAVKRRPQELAQELADYLKQVDGIEYAEPAGPGFVNLKITASVFQNLVSTILQTGESFGASQIGQGTMVNIEYVSANPTGPMHVGHCRGAVVGDVLANLMAKAGFDVTKEYYINDAGTQVVALTWAAYWRYLQALGQDLSAEAFEEKFKTYMASGLQYQGDYLVEVGRVLVKKHGDALLQGTDAQPLPTWFDIVKECVLEQMMSSIRQDLDALGVHQEVFVSERSILSSGKADQALKILTDKGLLYTGVLEPPKGKVIEDWEQRPQTLFKSTEYGDDVDRPLRKSDGTATYFANDIGYHYDKIERGAKILIDIWGADHGGYVPRMRAAIKALTDQNPVDFEVVLCQIVRVVRNGEVVKMSKRAGTFITLRDLIDEVGKDAVRFTMLTRKSDAQMNFDLEQVIAQTRDNPVFYVQYAHARCRSVLRSAVETLGADAVKPAMLAQQALTNLQSSAELSLMRRLAQWSRIVESAALVREPHRIAYYLMEVAADFHALWNAGRDDATLRFIQEDDLSGTKARLALVEATACVIRSAMMILGVEPVEEMR
ncbi:MULTISPECIES: arginine--tRNA ligase [Commensalibacter]|uniref:Arginine--tRNA ligase n=2 Tax=Commensalibacter TaxID=1079922 RepID=W7E8C8_9PROT|nr:arginyl-tRNA ligase [Commensalibacter papalotli (ex Servin-Garciduenas et al. 2014)]CAI3934910.1 Arginyl-tRNA synthetase (ArgS) (PDB:1BS2) [Commensalibacter papalotli (ex Botero et al. 2024)]CAI3951045.1 Arginyl-tRNA synthetase (ArgS) (PDB:1BS2) [Commensalibacter papalotli (ex Botero et al. 2024)]